MVFSFLHLVRWLWLFHGTNVKIEFMHIKLKFFFIFFKADIICFRWNEALIKEVLPIVYRDHLKSLISQILPSETVFSVLPVVNFTDQNWLPLLEPLYQKFLFNMNIFWTRANGGNWIQLDNSYFLNEDVAFEESDTLENVRNFFVASGVSLVIIPYSLMETVKTYLMARVKILRQVDLRRCVLQNDAQLRRLTFEAKMHLLDYILSDGNYDDLAGIKLLPTDHNGFKVFNHGEETIFIDNENLKTLLPGFRGRFLNAPEKIQNILIGATKNGRCKYSKLAYYFVIS